LSDDRAKLFFAPRSVDGAARDNGGDRRLGAPTTSSDGGRRHEVIDRLTGLRANSYRIGRASAVERGEIRDTTHTSRRTTHAHARIGMKFYICAITMRVSCAPRAAESCLHHTCCSPIPVQRARHATMSFATFDACAHAPKFFARIAPPMMTTRQKFDRERAREARRMQRFTRGRNESEEEMQEKISRAV
jgi:hypothetical protein